MLHIYYILHFLKNHITEIDYINIYTHFFTSGDIAKGSLVYLTRVRSFQER